VVAVGQRARLGARQTPRLPVISNLPLRASQQRPQRYFQRLGNRNELQQIQTRIEVLSLLDRRFGQSAAKRYLRARPLQTQAARTHYRTQSAHECG
jgi:hypothetical protein